MFNQSCGCQNNTNVQSSCGNSMTGTCRPMCRPTSCGCNNFTTCGCNNFNSCSQSFGCSNSVNGCPRPQPIVAPKRVCVSQQVTAVPQPVICPVECRRVNRCMYYPVYYPQYEQTCVNMPY